MRKTTSAEPYSPQIPCGNKPFGLPKHDFWPSGSTSGIQNSVCGVQNGASGFQNNVCGLQNYGSGLENSVCVYQKNTRDLQNTTFCLQNNIVDSKEVFSSQRKDFEAFGAGSLDPMWRFH